MPKITTPAPKSRRAVPTSERPFSLATGLLVFALVDLALFGLAAALVLKGSGAHAEDPVVTLVISVFLVLLAITVAVEIFRALRGKRAARKTLTYVAVMLVALAVLRRLLPFIALAVISGIGTALLWAPTSSAYFQLTEPKIQRLKNIQRAGGKAVQNFRRNQAKR